jgi:hypothetical protein
MYGGQDRFWWGNVGKRDHVENLGVYERIILKWIFNKWDGGINWIALAQDKDRWRALVNAVVNIRLHKYRGIS